MNQNVWGPHAWFFLHTISFNYPLNPSAEDKLRYKSFFYDLQHILPCKYCRNNYRKKLKETPIRLDSRKDLVEWLIDIHNEVNAQNGKKPLTYEQVKINFEKHYQKPIRIDSHTAAATEGLRLDISVNEYIGGALLTTVVLLSILYFTKW